MQEKCHQYWPSERSARYQYYVVDPMAEYNMPQYILREFKITDARVRVNLTYTSTRQVIRVEAVLGMPERGVANGGMLADEGGYRLKHH